jgi:iron only hydrogenase large subunit-like protein
MEESEPRSGPAAAPVYTLQSVCQDCYKCLRLCQVKAIDVRDGRAEIVRSRCLSCGQCLAWCPRQAKRIRDDLPAVERLLAAGEVVAFSLAPSWRGASGFNRARIIAALKGLGVGIVGETALGAEAVSMGAAEILNRSYEPGLHISSCCPVVVDYVRLYKPAFTDRLTPLASPALTHARLLKDHYGDDLKVVFVGPCVAKKTEADRHPELLEAALTFSELKRWMRDRQFGGDVRPIDEEASFSPSRSFEGALYALEGGMLEGLRKAGLRDGVQLVTVSGLDRIGQALDALATGEIRHPIFIEALACQGGCVGGPAVATDRSAILAMSDLLRHVRCRPAADPAAPFTRLGAAWRAAPVGGGGHGVEEIEAVLARLGKNSPEDELNCSGCGYGGCRELAAAILDGAAEPRMCVSNMRRLAARKASALVRAMPSAVVMVDRSMAIVEANGAFVKMFRSPKAPDPPPAPEDLAGEPVSDWIEFAGLIRKVIRTGDDVHVEHRVYRGRLYNLNIFSVEKYQLAGAIVTDMTSLKAGRDSLAGKVREVLDKNIATVQEIARLLGEHMVETESVLTAIAADLDEDGQPGAGAGS